MVAPPPTTPSLLHPPHTTNHTNKHISPATGPDDAALPIGYPQWAEILRALHRCFVAPSSSPSPTPMPQAPGRAPGQPSPIETLGLGVGAMMMGGESISTIKIPSRRSAEGEGTGGTTATGGRIRWVGFGFVGCVGGRGDCVF